MIIEYPKCAHDKNDQNCIKKSDFVDSVNCIVIIHIQRTYSVNFFQILSYFHFFLTLYFSLSLFWPLSFSLPLSITRFLFLFLFFSLRYDQYSFNRTRSVYFYFAHPRMQKLKCQRELFINLQGCLTTQKMCDHISFVLIFLIFAVHWFKLTHGWYTSTIGLELSIFLFIS